MRQAEEWFTITLPTLRRLRLHRSCVTMRKLGDNYFPSVDIKQAIGKTKYLKRYFRRGRLKAS